MTAWELPSAPQPFKSTRRQRTYASWSHLPENHFGLFGRSSPKNISERFLDFELFVDDVGLKPDPTNEWRLVRIRETRPWKKNNVVWARVKTAVKRCSK